MSTPSDNNNGTIKPIVDLDTNPAPSNSNPANSDPNPDTTIPNPTPDAITPPVKGDIVSINDVDYTIDEQGNAIDNEGKIVYSSEDVMQGIANVEAPPADTTVDPNIETLNNLSEHTVIIEGIEPAFTPEYVIAREKAIVEQATEAARTEAINTFLNNNRDIAELVKYKETFGTLEGFGQTVDYAAIDVATLDDANRIELIIQAEMKRGVTRERAERIAKLSEGDALVGDATEALNYLVKDQKDRIDSIRTEQERIVREYTENYNKETGVVYNQDGTIRDLAIQGSLYDDVVNKGKVLDLPIPSKGIIIVKDDKQVLLNRKELFDYLSKPMYEDNGQVYSQAEVDLYDKLADRKYRSLMALVAMKGIDSLVKAEADRKIVVRVKQQAKNVTNPNQGVSNPVQTGSGVKVLLD